MASADGNPVRADTGTDPYVQGWRDCAETIANLCETEATDLLVSRRRLADRIMNPALAEVYYRAAEIARATAMADRLERIRRELGVPSRRQAIIRAIREFIERHETRGPA